MADRPEKAASGTSRRASIHTLGCRLNQGETRIIEDRLRDSGYTIVPFGEPAELGVIHTCVVTREAEAKSRKYIHRFLRANPGAITAVIGCYAQTAGQAIAEMEGVDLVLGNDAKMLLPEHLVHLAGNAPVVARQRPERTAFTVPFLEEGPPVAKRVNLKIQDGCDLMCSYCYIPFARGRSRSRSLEDALAEARSLVRRGAKEIILTGVNLGDYRDQSSDLVSLVDQLSDLKPQPRIRISSIELTNLSQALFPRMADSGHGLAPHLHVPLQSGSDSVLKAMGRNYTAKEYLDLLNRAAAEVPDIGLGADVMAGFPGETEIDFEATCDVIRRSPLFHLHVFQYSERKQVASSRLPDKVSAEVLKTRSEALHRIAEEKMRAFQESWIGRQVRVLFENRQEGFWTGHGDNYLETAVSSPEDLENRFARVRITGRHKNMLFGGLDA